MHKTSGKNKAKNQWFRFYSEVLNDHKVQTLPPEMFRHWVNLLCLASECDGTLPELSIIAFKLRISEADASTVTETLHETGLLDMNADGELFPHNWSARQYKSDSSTDRVRKHREKARNTATKRNVSVTAPETETETETETEADTETEKKAASCCCNSELIWLKEVFDITEPEATEWLTEQIEIYGEGRVQAGVADYRGKFDSGGLKTHSMRTLRGFISSATPQIQQSDEPEHMRVYREMRAKQIAEQNHA